MATMRGRQVFTNTTVFGQADFFAVDGFTRVTGLTPSDLQIALFFNNMAQEWTLVTGLGISDTQVSAGKVYFNEIPGSAGYYNVRFRPNAVGYWRIVFTYSTVQQIVSQEYDVLAPVPTIEQGLKPSFIR